MSKYTWIALSQAIFALLLINHVNEKSGAYVFAIMAWISWAVGEIKDK